MVIENRVLRMTFLSKRLEVKRSWRKLFNKNVLIICLYRAKHISGDHLRAMKW
jgi:hypothetical protein